MGVLAATFNSIAARVQSRHRELVEQVGFRTTELDNTNEKLKAEIAERMRVVSKYSNDRKRLLGRTLRSAGWMT